MYFILTIIFVKHHNHLYHQRQNPFVLWTVVELFLLQLKQKSLEFKIIVIIIVFKQIDLYGFGTNYKCYKLQITSEVMIKNISSLVGLLNKNYMSKESK